MAYNNYATYGNGNMNQMGQMNQGYQNMQTVAPMNQMNQMNQGYQIPNTQQIPGQPVNGFVWVQGEMEAKMYPVAAGNSVMLMDSENPVLYMKTRDNTGKYLPMETYDLVQRVTPQVSQGAGAVAAPQIDLSEYVKISELETMINEKVKEAVDKALA